ncbi:MAG: indole-3-glycerol phosphate synthase TrpC [Treponema sp.]|jgi:indole-3-glycerol phosphate synthase|nr:indole-3-glycerol phosphate synthase TrpC [Treponema sp.]
MDILQEIAERTKERIEAKKKNYPLERLKEAVCSVADNGAYGFPFEKSLRAKKTQEGAYAAAGANEIAFICEIKKASPSKGVIAEDFPYLEIAKDYEEAGAAAVSVLTEPYYFMGDHRYLIEIASTVKIPLLRKDFTVDSYMIYEAKKYGASAVLLICAILDKQTLSEYISIADSLGLSSLVEAHNENEVKMALDCGARVIGVNNRDLKTFEVDTGNSIRLRKLVPDDIIFVSESGIRTAQDVELLRQNGVDAVLVGETLMRQIDRKAAIARLRSGKQ